jgi:hypothetical protein
MKFVKVAGIFLPFLALPCSAQNVAESSYSRLNTYGGFVEYSNDSSHIFLGQAMNRKIGTVGLQYARRLLETSKLNLSYTAEFRPAILESDPVSNRTIVQTSPTPYVFQFAGDPAIQCIAGNQSFSFSNPDGSVQAYTETTTCSRRTVVAQSLSPVGFRLNLRPRHRLQPTLSTNAGSMFSSQQIPVSFAGSFNFTFEFGGGLEFFRSRTRSVRLEYIVQHYSNAYTANSNPGVDSGFGKLTYAFGR